MAGSVGAGAAPPPSYSPTPAGVDPSTTAGAAPGTLAPDGTKVADAAPPMAPAADGSGVAAATSGFSRGIAPAPSGGGAAAGSGLPAGGGSNGLTLKALSGNLGDDISTATLVQNRATMDQSLTSHGALTKQLDTLKSACSQINGAINDLHGKKDDLQKQLAATDDDKAKSGLQAQIDQVNTSIAGQERALDGIGEQRDNMAQAVDNSGQFLQKLARNMIEKMQDNAASNADDGGGKAGGKAGAPGAGAGAQTGSNLTPAMIAQSLKNLGIADPLTGGKEDDNPNAVGSASTNTS